jgi:probable rRNA maturation factor
MNEPGPTDVLAFPMDELHDQRDDVDEGDAPPTLLGDVVLCPTVAERQAGEAGHSTEDELHLLCTHGVLHLLGYDHGDQVEEREMFGLQGQLLESWAVARRG